MKFCSECGCRVVHEIPPGDDRRRFVCPGCRTVHYQNPKVVVGCIPEWNGNLLLCRRAIEPREGFWTLPAGYLETGESVAEGAKRELMEEANAAVENLVPFAMFDIVFVGQIYFMFRGKLVEGRYSPGEESLETRLFDLSEIPWESIAFESIAETLRRYLADRSKGRFRFHTGKIRRHRSNS